MIFEDYGNLGPGDIHHEVGICQLILLLVYLASIRIWHDTVDNVASGDCNRCRVHISSVMPIDQKEFGTLRKTRPDRSLPLLCVL